MHQKVYLSNHYSGLPLYIFGWQERHSCGQITGLRPLLPSCCIPWNPGKTMVLLVLPLMAALLLYLLRFLLHQFLWLIDLDCMQVFWQKTQFSYQKFKRRQSGFHLHLNWNFLRFLIGWVKPMGYTCMICEKNGQVFSTHFFTNSSLLPHTTAHIIKVEKYLLLPWAANDKIANFTFYLDLSKEPGKGPLDWW